VSLVQKLLNTVHLGQSTAFYSALYHKQSSSSDSHNLGIPVYVLLYDF